MANKERTNNSIADTCPVFAARFAGAERVLKNAGVKKPSISACMAEVREPSREYKRGSAPTKPTHYGSAARLLNKVERLHKEDRARVLRIKEASAVYIASLKKAK